MGMKLPFPMVLSKFRAKLCFPRTPNPVYDISALLARRIDITCKQSIFDHSRHIFAPCEDATHNLRDVEMSVAGPLRGPLRVLERRVVFVDIEGSSSKLNGF